MLIYHPAFDTYHCLARVIKILENIPVQKYSKDRIKIYDYFLLFPNEIKKMTMPAALSHYKKLKVETRYNQVQNSRDIFMRISSFQELALNALASFELIDAKSFAENSILRSSKKAQFPIVVDEIEFKYFQFLNDYANKLPLKELKERTKLMEHRYELY
jgi:hypothetical protein